MKTERRAGRPTLMKKRRIALDDWRVTYSYRIGSASSSMPDETRQSRASVAASACSQMVRRISQGTLCE